ncbi:MAG: YeeE/YedE family protein [Candidatus Binataceae bacterium]
MANFTPWASLIGGLLIGAGASMLLLFNGKIAGISGILAGGIAPPGGEARWRWAFLAGLISAGAGLFVVHPTSFQILIERPASAFVAAGLLVGFGTRLGNGCTSGHGVCGISRGSIRSLVATLTFMATGAATVYLINHVVGGWR